MQGYLFHSRTVAPLVILALLTFGLPLPALADDTISASGRLDLRGIEALHSNTAREDPDLSGRIKIDAAGSSWKFHSWLEGGWDGTVKRPARDHDLLKDFHRVYQSNTPYLEFKELYLSYSSGNLDLRAGIQRFAWGRLDEYPSNDLLNPWDYTQFLRKPLEDRKIGVPSVSVTLNQEDWTYDAVWIPWFVPYRLPMPDERWSGTSISQALSQVPNAEVVPTEPGLPSRTVENSAVGLRVRRTGDIEWAINLFHGYDPKPVFRTTALVIDPQPGRVLIDPGYVPDFHRITSIGMDAAAVKGDWSMRLEAACIINRYHNIRRELWGYPLLPAPGVTQLQPIERRSDALDYGIGADYRLFEDGLVTMQAQQTVILGNTELLYEKKIETILWANLKVGWMNQKMETNASIAFNPEHGAAMSKGSAWYVFTDAWKAGMTAISFSGPPQSLFGRYARNDQAEAEVVYSW